MFLAQLGTIIFEKMLLIVSQEKIPITQIYTNYKKLMTLEEIFIPLGPWMNFLYSDFSYFYRIHKVAK